MTRNRYKILAVLLETDRHMKAAEIAQRTKLHISIVRLALIRLEAHGWLDVDGPPLSRQGLSRGFKIAPHIRPHVRTTIPGEQP